MARRGSGPATIGSGWVLYRTAPGSPDSPLPVARDGFPAAGPGDRRYKLNVPPISPSFAPDGTLFAQVVLEGSEFTVSDDACIVAYAPGEFVPFIVVRENSPTMDFSCCAVGEPSRPTVAVGGDLIFSASLRNASIATTAFWNAPLASPSAFRAFAATGTLVAGLSADNPIFSVYTADVAPDGVSVHMSRIFNAGLPEASNFGIFFDDSVHGHAPRFLVRSGTIPPGLGMDSRFDVLFTGGVAINARHQTAFCTAAHSTQTPFSGGIWCAGTSGDTALVAHKAATLALSANNTRPLSLVSTHPQGVQTIGNRWLNDRGQIAFSVHFDSQEPSGAMLLALIDACPADFDLSGTVNYGDLIEFLQAWFAGDPRADMDCGGLSTMDIFAYLNAWLSPC